MAQVFRRLSQGVLPEQGETPLKDTHRNASAGKDLGYYQVHAQVGIAALSCE